MPQSSSITDYLASFMSVLSLKGHARSNCCFRNTKRSLVGQGTQFLGAWFQGWSLLLGGEMSLFNSNWKQRIGVENAHFYARKEEPTLKPSSQKLGTCQSQKYFCPWPTEPHYKNSVLKCVLTPHESSNHRHTQETSKKL